MHAPVTWTQTSAQEQTSFVQAYNLRIYIVIVDGRPLGYIDLQPSLSQPRPARGGPPSPLPPACGHHN